MPRSLRVGTSNLNMPVDKMLAGEHAYDEFGADGGYDGFQLMPVRFKTRLYRKLARDGKVLGLLESWASPRSIIANLKPGRVKSVAEAVGASLVFPSRSASHRHLRSIRKAAGGRPGVIVHPTGQELGDLPSKRRALPKDIDEPSWQITSELLESWRVNSDVDESEVATVVEQIDAARKVRGLGRVVLDTNHSTAEMSHRHPIANIIQLAGALAAKGLIDRVEVSLRPDFGGKPGDIAAVASGGLADTIHGQILKSVAEHTPATDNLLVITEVRADAVAKAVPDMPLADFHASLTGQIREIVDPYLPPSQII